jgi:hypothetical protein
LAATKYWRRQNIGGDRNYWRRQNSRVDKIPALTKSRRRQNLGIDKISASTKCWRRHRRSPLLFCTAESTAADFFQTSLKISYVSLMVLISLHAVTKYGVALWLPCFYGRTLSRTVPACRTGPPCRKRHKFWRQQIIGGHRDLTIK